MAKKKLLSEAQVRRFMGLAGLDASLSSNVLSEAGLYEEEPEEAPVEDEEMLDDEEAAATEEPVVSDEEPVDAMGDIEGEEAEDTKEISQDLVDKIPDAIATLQDLGAALGAEEEPAAADEMPEPDLAPPGDELAGEEEPMPAEEEPAEEEPVEDEEVLEGVSLELSEEELVQEVAKRVAKRILKAKKAQKQLDEALGRKK